MASRPPRLPGVPQEVFGSLGRPGENGLLLSCRSLDPAIAKCDLAPTPEVDSGKGVRKASGDAPDAVRDSEFAKPLWKCRGGLGATLRPLPLQQPLAPNPALDCAQFRYLRRAEQALRPQIMPYAAAFGGGATVATWLPGPMWWEGLPSCHYASGGGNWRQLVGRIRARDHARFPSQKEC